MASRHPPWKRLVLELTDQGFESPYLDRLRRKLDVEPSHRELEKEILQEMAAALGRAEDKLNLALLELQLLGRKLDAAEDPEGFHRGIDAYNAQREVARRRLWELTIHREALGFRGNEILTRFYPIPPRLPRGRASHGTRVRRRTPLACRGDRRHRPAGLGGAGAAPALHLATWNGGGRGRAAHLEGDRPLPARERRAVCAPALVRSESGFGRDPHPVLRAPRAQGRGPGEPLVVVLRPGGGCPWGREEATP